MWFIGVELEQETSALPPKKNPGSAPGITTPVNFMILYEGILIRYLEEAQRICRIVQAQEMSDKAVDKTKKDVWLAKIQVSQRGLIIESL